MLADILEQPSRTEVADDKRHTVLVIDDDEVLTDLLSRRLEQQGFEVLIADSGESGLLTARCERPALIVLDLGLPDIDGFDVCAELADAPDTCTIPVVVLSGMERPDILRRCRAAGCRYFLRKPYDPNVLLLVVRRAIEEMEEWNEAGDGD